MLQGNKDRHNCGGWSLLGVLGEEDTRVASEGYSTQTGIAGGKLVRHLSWQGKPSCFSVHTAFA